MMAFFKNFNILSATISCTRVVGCSRSIQIAPPAFNVSSTLKPYFTGLQRISLNAVRDEKMSTVASGCSKRKLSACRRRLLFQFSMLALDFETGFGFVAFDNTGSYAESNDKSTVAPSSKVACLQVIDLLEGHPQAGSSSHRLNKAYPVLLNSSLQSCSCSTENLLARRR